jgi:hypothetical protein
LPKAFRFQDLQTAHRGQRFYGKWGASATLL